MYLCLTFLSYPLSLAGPQFQEILSCPPEVKEFTAIFVSFTRGEVFFAALSRSHVFAQLFCFVITVATRNNIVKWYLHERANPFLIYFGGVQGAGRRLSYSSLMPFSLLYQNAYKHFKCTFGISSREIKINN